MYFSQRLCSKRINTIQIFCEGVCVQFQLKPFVISEGNIILNYLFNYFHLVKKFN